MNVISFKFAYGSADIAISQTASEVANRNQSWRWEHEIEKKYSFDSMNNIVASKTFNCTRYFHVSVGRKKSVDRSYPSGRWICTKTFRFVCGTLSVHDEHILHNFASLLRWFAVHMNELPSTPSGRFFHFFFIRSLSSNVNISPIICIQQYWNSPLIWTVLAYGSQLIFD